MNDIKTEEQPLFNERELSEVDRLIAQYPEGKEKSALLPLLHLAQDKWSWLSVPVMDYIATLLNIQPIEVYEVASFYTMYHLEPKGKVVLEVCRTGPCALVGSDQLIGYLEQKLDVEAGGTTADGMFTLKPVECLAACGYGPMMQVGARYYENLNEGNIDSLLDNLRREAEETGPIRGNSLPM